MVKYSENKLRKTPANLVSAGTNRLVEARHIGPPCRDYDLDLHLMLMVLIMPDYVSVNRGF